MGLLFSIGISYRAIKSNKVRSFLTALGVIIGVAAVISLVSITGGAKNMIEGQLSSLGANSLVVRSGKNHQKRKDYPCKQIETAYREGCGSDRES